MHTDSNVWEVRTGHWEVRIDIQKGRNNVKEVRITNTRSAKWAFRIIEKLRNFIRQSSRKGIHLNKVDGNKIVAYEGFIYGKNGSKCFVSYKKQLKTTPLLVLTPQIRGYVKHFDDAKTISLLIEHKNLLLKYKEMWKTIQSILIRYPEKEFWLCFQFWQTLFSSGTSRRMWVQNKLKEKIKSLLVIT